MDVHARIHTFLQHKTIPLVFSIPEIGEEAHVKAGVVPFVRRDGHILYHCMKPVAKHSDLPEPAFQICKGTRMQQDEGGKWVDMRDNKPLPGKKETLAETALREGIEELGLKLEAIRQVLNVGSYRFASQMSGRVKYMWLFALEMASTEELLPMSEVASTTAGREWLGLEQFDVVGREDHRYILRDIDAKLRHYYKE